MITHLSPEPGYCAHQTMASKPLSPSQWAACLKYGWNEPTTSLGHVGYTFGHTVLPVLIVVAVLAAGWLLLRRRRGSRPGRSGSPVRRPVGSGRR